MQPYIVQVGEWNRYSVVLRYYIDTAALSITINQINIMI